MMTRRLWVAGAATLAISVLAPAWAQQSAAPYVRWAELEVEPGKTAAFTGLALENAAATRQEPGVIAFHFAAEKGNPGRIRVLEIYSDQDAYRAHLQSAHFQRFAQASQSAIAVRRIYDAVPILLGSKRSLSSAAPHVRVAELEIDPIQLEAYKAAVTEEIEASIRLEPGVLAIYSLALKDRPTHLRFLEIYADESSYRQHIESPHFKKYVETTRSMITSRKLFEMESPSAAMSSAIAAPGAQARPQAAPAKPAYYISEFELTDPEGIRPYSAAVESTFAPFGGRYAARGGKVVSLEGEPSKRVIMIVFPSLEQAQAWYDSPRYREIMPIRHRSARSRVFILEGLPN